MADRCLPMGNFATQVSIVPLILSVSTTVSVISLLIVTINGQVHQKQDLMSQ